jgi:hypothetical protein
MENNIIRVRNKTPLYLLIYIIIFFLFGIWIIFSGYYNNIYFDLGFGFFFGLIVILFNVSVLLLLFLRNKIEYNSEFIRCLNYKNQILCEIKYIDIQYYSKYGFGDYEEITIHTTKNKIKIGINNCKHYSQISNIIKEKNIQFDNDKQEKDIPIFKIASKHSKYIFIAWIVFVIFSITMGFIIKEHNDRDEKITVMLPLLELSDFNKSLRSTNGFYVLRLTNEEFNSYLSSKRLEKLEEVPLNDTIEVLMSKRDYDVKILKQVTPTFFDKHFSWSNIIIWKIKYNGEIVYRKK